MNETDGITIEGLGVLLDEDTLTSPFLDLTIRTGNDAYRAQILVAGDEWALTVTNAAGHQVVQADFFPSQAEAILAAQLAVLTLRLEFGS